MARGKYFDDMIKACEIFRKYNPDNGGFCCEHDVMHVAVSPGDVSEEDVQALDELGFFPDDAGGFASYRFGSC